MQNQQIKCLFSLFFTFVFVYYAFKKERPAQSQAFPFLFPLYICQSAYFPIRISTASLRVSSSPTLPGKIT